MTDRSAIQELQRARRGALRPRKVVGRTAIISTLSGLIGAAVALLTASALTAPPRQAVLLPAPVRISVRAAAQTPSAAPAMAPVVVTPQTRSPAPQRQTRVETAKAPPKRNPAPLAGIASEPATPAPEPATAETEPFDQPLATLSQPDIGASAAPPAQQAARPSIGAADAPAAPAEGEVARDYPEQPGGSVLVLGMLINASGKVLDTRILVPSFNQLANLSVSMAALGKTWTDINPPLSPGETRWVELRIPFQDPLKPQTLVP